MTMSQRNDTETPLVPLTILTANTFNQYLAQYFNQNINLGDLQTAVQWLITNGGLTWPAFLIDGEIPILFDGGGSAIAAGQTIFIKVPFDCSLDAWEILADQAGTIDIDIQGSTFANYPTAVSILPAAPDGTEPIIGGGGAAKKTDVCSSWQVTTLAKGDILVFVINSCAMITRALISLKVTRA